MTPNLTLFQTQFTQSFFTFAMIFDFWLKSTNGYFFTSAWTEHVDYVRLRKGAVVFGRVEGVSLSLGRHLAWSGRAAKVKRWLALDAAARGRADVIRAWKRSGTKLNVKISYLKRDLIVNIDWKCTELLS